MDYDLAILGADAGASDAVVAASRLGYRVAWIANRHGSCSAGAGGYTTSRRAFDLCGLSAESRVDVYYGRPHFVDSHRLVVETLSGRESLSSSRFVVAAGVHLESGAAPDEVIANVASQSLKSAIVLVDGLAGIQFATQLIALGLRTIIVDGDDTLAACFDPQLAAEVIASWRRSGSDYLVGDTVIRSASVDASLVVTMADTGEHVVDRLFDWTSLHGSTADLGLELAGVELDERGQIWCDAAGRSTSPHIFAAGDVIGFPRRTAFNPCVSLIPTVFDGGPRPEFGRLRMTPEVVVAGDDAPTIERRAKSHRVGTARRIDAGGTHSFLKILLDESDGVLGFHGMGPAVAAIPVFGRGEHASHLLSAEDAHSVDLVEVALADARACTQNRSFLDVAQRTNVHDTVCAT